MNLHYLFNGAVSRIALKRGAAAKFTVYSEGGSSGSRLSVCRKTMKQLLLSGVQPHFVFPATGAAEKHLISEKTRNARFFKGTGVVLAGKECSPEIFDFRANGFPVQRLSTLSTISKAGVQAPAFLNIHKNIFIFTARCDIIYHVFLCLGGVDL